LTFNFLCCRRSNLGETFGEDSPLGQAAFRQRQRPRCNRSITCVPWTGRSFRERQYRLWREREMDWQPGQAAEF
jgi:hypothetical protein